ncbi:MAG: homocysteine S-methyltransferase family protein [Candidatus Marinimicrobia bacterium]|nr:homocysteine S-methyltransferase family protein [Candidatus Neomarinimicrobiota bacterium]
MTLEGLLADNKIVVADGAMGTILMGAGMPPANTPEAINLSHPDILENIAAAYLAAGSQIIQTNTFGASATRLAEFGLADRTVEINTAAVKAVRKVVGEKALVSGSCGPSGKLLAPYGDGDPDDIKAGFRRQMVALIDAGADLICVETMIDPVEAELAITAAREIAPHIPIMATMTFDETPKGYYTMMGTGIIEAAQRMEQAGATVVGSNCGNGLRKMIAIGGQFVQATQLPVIIQSNAGLPEMIAGDTVFPETPDYFGALIHELVETGVAIVGGCCGTTPEHIKSIRAVVDAL